MRNGLAQKIDGADIAERTKRVQLSFVFMSQRRFLLTSLIPAFKMVRKNMFR